MKINAVLIPKEKKTKNQPLYMADKSLVFVSCSIAFGIVLGAVSYALNIESFSSEYWKFFFDFHTVFSNKSYLEVLSGLVFSLVPYFVLMVLLGTSTLGRPFVCIATFVKSLGLGSIAAYLYTSFGLKGVEYCMLVLFPGKIILIFAMVLLTQTSFQMSRRVCESYSDITANRAQTKKFLFSNLVIFLIMLLSCIVDSITISLFSSLFEFG